MVGEPPVTTDSWCAPQPLDETCGREELIVQIAHLQAALVNRDQIGQAKGIIRLLTGADSDGAFELLSKMSQDTNRKITDIAIVIADSATAGAVLPPDLRASWRKRTGG
jgi:hypothetical protein